MNTCTLTGTLLNIDGTPCAFAGITAYLDAPLGYTGVRWTAGATTGRNKVTATTNRQGDFELTLAQGICVMLDLPDVDGAQRFIVPSVDAANLFDYLYPVSILIDWAQLVADGDSWAIAEVDDQLLVPLAVGETLNLVLRSTYSNATSAIFGVDAFVPDPDNGFETVGEGGLALTLDLAGDIVVAHTFASSTLSAASESPILLLPEADYDIPLPAAITLRFS